MRGNFKTKNIFLIICALGALIILLAGVATADSNWTDQLIRSIDHLKKMYPSSNFEPYSHQLDIVREAVDKGDEDVIRMAMNTWFQMINKREHGIDMMAAYSLLNYSKMIIPFKQYGITAPRG